jgi:plasmid stability protein
MGQDVIIDLDDEVIERWKRKAQVNGRSLEEELREIITISSHRAVKPPSMTNSAPVTKLDSSDKR